MRFSLSVLLGCLLAVSTVGAGVGCTGDDDGPVIEPIEGEKEGTVRYIVYLEGEGPDLTAYKAARAEGKSTTEIEAALRTGARKRARKLKRKLKSVGARVVDTWYLSNALTVELPEANVATLKGLSGIEKIVPDTLLGD